MKHRIVCQRPGVYRIVAAPESLIQRLWRWLFTIPHRPQPTRLAPSLAALDEGGNLVPTIAVSLAMLRRCRPLMLALTLLPLAAHAEDGPTAADVQALEDRIARIERERQHEDTMEQINRYYDEMDQRRLEAGMREDGR